MTSSLTPSLFSGNLTDRERVVSALSAIHNNFYANDGLSPEQALEETVKLLFLKFIDESNNEPKFRIESEELQEVTSRGSSSTFEDRIHRLSSKTFEAFPDLFEQGSRLKVKTTSIAFAVCELCEIRFSDLPHDVKGAAFQVFLNASQRVGRGQFFTPEPVVEFCVGVLAPSKGEVVVDPACGSAGFLASAFAYSSLKSSGPCVPIGFEISHTAARLARMRMLLIGAELGEIHQTDALASAKSLAGLLRISRDFVPSDEDGFADIVLTNPPFGTQGKINDVKVLSGFELGHRWDTTSNPFEKLEVLSQQVPELLFIEQCVRLLRPGGRLGIVLPNGNFENSSLRYVREFLLGRVTVDAIVKLPQETFVPSGTGIKTSLLFATKNVGTANEKQGRQIFFGEITKLGYTGNKVGSAEYLRDSSGRIVLDASQRPVVDEDFSAILRAFLRREKSELFPASSRAYEAERLAIDSTRFDYEFHHPKYAFLAKSLIDTGALPLKEIVKLVKGRPTVLSQPDAEVQYVELSDVGLEYQEIVNSETLFVHELPSRASYQIQTGQLLIAVAGNSIGTSNHVSALVSQEFDGAICSNGFRVMNVVNSDIDPLYLLFALSTPEVRHQIFRLRTGAAIPSISDTDLLSVLIPRRSREDEAMISSTIRNSFAARLDFRRQMRQFREELAD